MKCVVLFLVAAACVAAGEAAVAACSSAHEFLIRHNATADGTSEPGPLCGGQCCGRGQEEHLRSSLRRVVESRLAITTRPIRELLLSTRRTLQEHLTELSHQSQNKTEGFFLQLYRWHATRARAPLDALYEDIRTMLRPSHDHDANEAVGSPAPKDLYESSIKFFREVFPVAYQSVLKLEAKRFTPEYEECLKSAYDSVLPFGDIPVQMGLSLSRHLGAARILLQVLAEGARVLTSSDVLLAHTNEECSNKLLKMGGCAVCRGYDVRPCRNYCLNVGRGCIGSLAAELDAPWAGYVEGLERVARPEPDTALRELEAQVSKAIMYALENHSILENKVRQQCGAPSTFDVPTSSLPRPVAPRRDALRAPPPYTELLQFSASLARNKKLFSKLADRLCDDPDFENEGNDNCWNGDAVGEYTKPLAASASLNDQKYNPEVSGTPTDFQISALGDRLRHARQICMLQLSHKNPSAEAFMQGDEAGEEGSGSGRNYDNDDTYDDEGSGEEGSGLAIGGERKYDVKDDTGSSTPKTAAATASRPFLSFILALAMLSGYCLI